VHGGLGRKPAKNHESAFRRSNRDQTETPNSTSKSLTYDILMFKHWDTTDIQSLVTKKKSANPYELAGLVKTPNHALGRSVGLRMSSSFLVWETPEISPPKGNLIFVIKSLVQAIQLITIEL
jgi:hypothetical protein